MNSKRSLHVGFAALFTLVGCAAEPSDESVAESQEAYSPASSYEGYYMPTSTASASLNTSKMCGEMTFKLTSTPATYGGVVYTHTVQVVGAGDNTALAAGDVTAYLNFAPGGASGMVREVTSSTYVAFTSVAPVALRGGSGLRPNVFTFGAGGCWQEVVQVTGASAFAAATPIPTIKDNQTPLGGYYGIEGAWHPSSGGSCSGTVINFTKASSTDPEGYGWDFKGTYTGLSANLSTAGFSVNDVGYYLNYLGSVRLDGIVEYQFYWGRVQWRDSSALSWDHNYWLNNDLVTVKVLNDGKGFTSRIGYNDTESDACGSSMIP